MTYLSKCNKYTLVVVAVCQCWKCRVQAGPASSGHASCFTYTIPLSLTCNANRMATVWSNSRNDGAGDLPARHQADGTGPPPSRQPSVCKVRRVRPLRERNQHVCKFTGGYRGARRGGSDCRHVSTSILGVVKRRTTLSFWNAIVCLQEATVCGK